MVGHPKCGTTALYEMLRRHPQIYMPDTKEPDFFSVQEVSDVPEETLNDYLSLFDAAKPEQRIGEASVSYLTSRTAASGIATMQPAAKIIAILREPASFLRSLHLQFVQSNVEREKNFRKALSLEDARRQGRYSHHPESPWGELLPYSEHIRYVEQLSRYKDRFPPGQVMVLIYDDFRRDNDTALRTVLRFLNVDDIIPINVAEVNPTVEVRSQYLNRIIYGEQGPVWRAMKEVVKVLTPRVGQSLRRVVYSDPPPPDGRLMVELRRRFKPEVAALSEYLDRDLVTLWGYDRVD